MSDFWHAAADWAAHTALAGGLVLGLGWAWLMFVRQPARRQRLAAWTVRAAVLVAVLCLLPGWLRVPVPDWAKQAADEPPPAPPVWHTAVERPAVNPPGGYATGLPRHGWTTEASGQVFLGPAPAELQDDEDAPAESPDPAPAAAAAPAAGPPAPRDYIAEITPLVLVPYAVIAAAGLLQLAAGQVALARLRRTGRPAAPALQAAFADLAFGIPFGPRLLVSDTVSSPVCFGVFLPTVLLPRALVGAAAPAELRWVLAHELDHLRRGDTWTGVWVAVARAVFFFLPWFWAVRRELSLAQEYLADAAAAAAGGRSVDYAAFLVNLSARPGESRPVRHPLGAAGVRAGHTDLFRRVTMLLKASPGLEKSAPRGWTWLAAGGVVSAAVVLSGIGWAADDTPKAKKVVVVEEKTDEAKKDGEKKGAGKKEEKKVIEIHAKAGSAEDIAKAKKAVEDAVKKGDIDAARAAMEKLEKALSAHPLMIVNGQEIPFPQFPMAPVPPGFQVFPGGNFKLWTADAEDPALKEMEKAIAGLKKAAEQVKDQPEAKAALDKSIAEYQKKIDEAKKRAAANPRPVPQAAPVPPLPPVPNIVLDWAGQHEKIAEQLKKSMKAMEKQLEGLADDPEAKDALKKAMEQYQRAMDESLKQLEQGGQFRWQTPFAPGQGAHNFQWNVKQPTGRGRFGIHPEAVPEPLIEQLDLPKGLGVLLTQVVKDSPADKAGLRANDILLKIGDKDVPSDPTAVAKLIADLKSGDPFEATVLRKGKKMVMKVTLPEATKPAAKEAVRERVTEKLKDLRKSKGAEESDSINKGRPANVKFSSMAVSVNNDEFTIKAETDEVRYAIEGTLANGKPVPSSISIRSGSDKKQEYKSLDKVPAEHQAAVKQLLGSVGGGTR
jgi:beta-lactamase regulating signal transducer with metallopeptidase domain